MTTAYGIMYGMQKTTVYLPDALKAALSRAAAESGLSEADLIRTGVRLAIEQRTPPAPSVGIFGSGTADASERVDELLATGFGTR